MAIQNNGNNTLYWFTQDLRLHDNPALAEAANSESLLCVYTVNPDWFKPRRFHHSQMGTLRWQFLQQSLYSLNQSLQAHQQYLHTVYDKPEQAIPGLCRQHHINRIIISRQFGVDENRILAAIQQAVPRVEIIEIDNYTLFDASVMETGFPVLGKGYTPFKNKALTLLDTIDATTNIPGNLPPTVTKEQPVLALPDWLPKPSKLQYQYNGGEVAANLHLEEYFGSDFIASYHSTRNALTGFGKNRKLSPWLNTGALSVREVYRWIATYQSLHGKTLSSQSLLLELLRREYFQWLASTMGSRLFTVKGLKSKSPLKGFYPERFQRWCHGSTPYPLVNACMTELKETGYLSNRGRQIAASCLVNELDISWVYGAAYFEQQLLDYDMAVNWCNWQYIAGVGVESGGEKHFDLDKQQQRFDPEMHYINQWAPTTEATHNRLDSVGIDDWPV